MDEQVINDLYNRAKSQGYAKPLNDFITLLHSDNEVFNDNFQYVKSNGYQKNANEFSSLVGKTSVAQVEPLKKKVPSPTALPLEDTFSASQKQLPSFEVSPLREEVPVAKEPLLKNKKAFDESMDRNAYLDNLGTGLISGLNTFEKMVASAPESAYDIIGIVPNYLLQKAGLDLEMSSDKLKSTLGITNPLLDKLNEEEKALRERTTEYNKKYETTGIVDNFQKGNYQDGFELLGRSIVENAPTSIAMMVGGATVTAPELFAASTAGFFKQNQEQLAEENPNMSNVEKNIKALAMASAETVFESIGTGTIGKVYKDIIKKEGKEVGQVIFRDGLVKMYETALKKFGAPIGLVGEGLGEAATQITQNIISEKPAFEGAADAFVTGAGSGVMFTAPISALKARDKVRDLAETYKSKDEINQILKDKDNALDNVYNVPKGTAITPEQLAIANTNKSRDILVKNLDRSVKDGVTSEEDAKQSLYIFDKIQQVSNNVKDLNVTNEEKAEIATLLSKRNDLTTDIQNKDDVLVVKEKQEIADINKRIQDIILASQPQGETAVIETPEVTAQRTARINELEALVAPGSELSITSPEWSKAVEELQTLKKEQDAIQKQTTDEGLLRGQQPEMGLQKVGEGNIQPEGVATGAEEKIGTESGPEEIIPIEEIPVKEAIVESIIEDQKQDSQKEGYEYSDLYNQDPRLAAVQNYKDVLDFVSTPEYVNELIKLGETEESAKDSQTRSIENAQKNIDLLNKNLEESPVKQTVTKRAPAPTTKLKLVENTKKALKSIYPNLPIETFDGMIAMRNWARENYGSAFANRLGNVRGAAVFDSETKLPKFIMLNNESYASTTLPHEVWHLLLAKAFGKTPESQRLFKGFRESIEKTLREGGYGEIADKLAEHAENDVYKKSKKISEEWLVQFGAYMTQSGLKIGELNPREQSILNKIKDIVNKYAMKLFNTPIFLEEATADNVLEFITTISDSLRRGEDLNKYFKESQTEKAKEGEVEIEKEAITDYDKVKENIKSIISSAKKSGTTKDIIAAKVLKYLINSDAYKNADETQREQMYEDARNAINPKPKTTPKVKVSIRPTVTKLTVNEMSALKDQIRKEATAAKEGAKSISDSVKAITEYFNSIKDRANLTRSDLNKVIKTIATIKNQATLDKAADTIFGIVEKAQTDTIEVSEYKALKSQIKLEAKAAREAKADLNTKRKRMASLIRDMQKAGKIAANKVSTIINKISNVNLDSTEAVDRFIDYVGKVFKDAEYDNKLNIANALKKSISKLAKNKDKNADLRDLSKRFTEINPSMVDDIDAYNEMAEAIKEATKGSTIRGEDIKFADMVSIKDANEYISEIVDSQNKAMREQKIAQIQELMGIDASELSYDDMMSLLESEEPITKYNEGIIRDTINKMFDLYSAVINDTIKTGINPVTNEEIDFTSSQKDVVKQFMAMDLNLLSPKEALQAVDALSNFLTNGSTARMNAVIADYTGKVNSGIVVKKGIKAAPISKYWSPLLGRYLAAYTKDLNLVFEQMFKGFYRSGIVEKLSGVSDIVKGNSIAKRLSDKIANEYVDKFFKREANKEAFNTAYNSVERDMIARAIRNIAGTDAEVKAEFERRKNLIQETIDVLAKGDEKQQETSTLMVKAYNKLLQDAESIEDVKAKADPVNMEAVNFWIEKWSDIYDQLADISSGVYNKTLEKDSNYTPDRFARSAESAEPLILDANASAFHGNNNTLYKKETGVLMKATRPKELPKNMYLSMSFDKNMTNAMHDALVDIHTAIPIRQTQAFLNSENFNKIVPTKRDATLLKDRIALYVQNIRKKNPFRNDELSDVLQKINRIASIGAGQALGGLGMPFKQSIPVAMNTIVNAGKIDLSILLNKSKNTFIDNSGYSIANRGSETATQIESIDRIIDEAAKSKGAKLFKLIEEANKKWLKYTLVNFDIFIARASWMTYYEKSLEKQGIDTKSIDYSTHKINEEAADYAERMVSRQQKTSDSDLAGKMFVSKEPSAQILVKLLMPFASFRMNQAARLGADISTVSDGTASLEDKKVAIRSLVGFGVEMATFKVISASLLILLGTVAKKLMGKDEDEEEKKKRIDAVIKGQRTSTVTDVLSPLPVIDIPIQTVTSSLLDATQNYMDIPKEEQTSIYAAGGVQDYIKSLGMFGISLQRAKQFADISYLAATGKYTDDYGKEKTISEEDRKKLQMFVLPALMSNIGLLPAEGSTIIKNVVKDAKKKQVSPEAAAEKEERVIEKEENITQKISALNELKDKTTSEDELKVIDDKLYELTASSEEKKQLKQERKVEDKIEEELLYNPIADVQYDNQSEMKRYAPALYKRNFGIGSDWYEDHKYEQKVEKKLSQEIRKEEDIEMGYSKKSKVSKTGLKKLY